MSLETVLTIVYAALALASVAFLVTIAQAVYDKYFRQETTNPAAIPSTTTPVVTKESPMQWQEAAVSWLDQERAPEVDVVMAEIAAPPRKASTVVQRLREQAGQTGDFGSQPSATQPIDIIGLADTKGFERPADLDKRLNEAISPKKQPKRQWAAPPVAAPAPPPSPKRPKRKVAPPIPGKDRSGQTQIGIRNTDTMVGMPALNDEAIRRLEEARRNSG